MTELQEPQGTKSLSKKRQKRSVYLQQKREATISKLLHYQESTGVKILTPLEEYKTNKDKLLLLCPVCRSKFLARPADFLRTSQDVCNSCSRRRVMKRILSTEAGKKKHRDMTAKAVAGNKKDPRFVRLRRRCNEVKSRCACPTNKRYPYYGGRGVEFRFVSPLAMAKWIVANLGYPEQPGLSLDRIDNDGHYESGNLRWATPSQQGRNKRKYKVSKRGARIRMLQKSRPDFCYETIRTFINQGMSDNDIIQKKKSTSGRPRVRHS